MSGHAAPSRYQASAATPDGPIVYRTDDRDELVSVTHRHAAAGHPLALTAWDETAGAYLELEAA